MKITWNWKTITYSLCLLLASLLSIADASAAALKSYEFGECDGSMAECGAIAEEFSMESEASPRILAEAKKFISPGALRADSPACGGGARGIPYSKSCLPPASNPQQRGCQTYKMCRG